MINALTDEQLEPHVEALERIITLYAERHGGFSMTELTARNRASRLLPERDKFRLAVLLCKRPTVSVTVGRSGKLTFHSRHDAPKGAFNIAEVRERIKAERESRQAEGAVIQRACELTA